MSDLHRLADKVFTEAELLDQMLWRLNHHDGYENDEHLCIALQQAKTVRRHSNVLVRALAAHRDHLQRTSAQGE